MSEVLKEPIYDENTNVTVKEETMVPYEEKGRTKVDSQDITDFDGDEVTQGPFSSLSFEDKEISTSCSENKLSDPQLDEVTYIYNTFNSLFFALLSRV